MNKKIAKYFIVFLLFVFELSLAQKKNPTAYPYGGVPDSSRFEDWMKEGKLNVPLNFKKANFDSAYFDSLADFGWAQFDGRADFREVQFDSLADFGWAQFDGRADFRGAQFHSRADFREAQFDSWVYFEWAQFDSLADFRRAQFDSWVYLEGAQFHSRADFGWVRFHSLADFGLSKIDIRSIGRKAIQFYNVAYFYGAKFDILAYFREAQFDSLADFREAQFDSLADFEGAQFDSRADFRGTKFDSLADFERANIGGEFFIGSREGQKFDFTRTIFSAQAKIILCELAEINIQTEKIKYISFFDSLSYNLKRLIIDNLKEKSFSNNSKAQFELEYIFIKSTMYQDKRDVYIENKWYQIWKYPKWFLNTLYNITMGMGYRPFRLAWWVLGLIISFGIFYFFKMRDSINGYILKKYEMKGPSDNKRKNNDNDPKKISHTESLINCFYFSSMLLFAFRLKGEILTFFGLKEKRIIVGEYLLGLLIYISFLTLAKSGSILNNLKSLFIG